MPDVPSSIDVGQLLLEYSDFLFSTFCVLCMLWEKIYAKCVGS